MPKLSELKAYKDEADNQVIYDGAPIPGAAVAITFRGKNNTLRIADGAKIVDMSIDFSGDGGLVDVATTSKKRAGIRFSARLGHESSLIIGENVGFESRTYIRASEGASVTIGEDCMLAASVELRADDTHAIYHVRTGKRANPARSIMIGEHVWLGKSVVVMSGATIGAGSVVGFRSVVTGEIPNNCVAAGTPARVVRKDVAWERPVLSFRRPGLDGLSPDETKSEKWWNLTEEDSEAE